jgi:hypothetical protein
MKKDAKRLAFFFLFSILNTSKHNAQRKRASKMNQYIRVYTSKGWQYLTLAEYLRYNVPAVK